MTLEQGHLLSLPARDQCQRDQLLGLGIDVKLGDEMNGFVASERFHPDERYEKPLGAAVC